MFHNKLKFPKPHAAQDQLFNSVLFPSKALKNIVKSQEECKTLSSLTLLLKYVYMLLTSTL